MNIEFNDEVKAILEAAKGLMIHQIMGISWKWYRKNYLIPMGLPKHEWERLKFEGKIPWKAKWAPPEEENSAK